MVFGFMILELSYGHTNNKETVLSHERRKNEIKTQSQYAFENWTYRSSICDKSTFLRRSNMSKANKPEEEAIEIEKKIKKMKKGCSFELYLIRLAKKRFHFDCLLFFIICANENCLRHTIKIGFMNETTWRSKSISDKKQTRNFGGFESYLLRFYSIYCMLFIFHEGEVKRSRLIRIFSEFQTILWLITIIPSK